MVRDGIRGNAELKVHNPSVVKKKGATIEIRKISDFEYTFVENLKKVVSSFLDRIIDGEEVEGLGRNTNKTFLGVTPNFLHVIYVIGKQGLGQL